MKASNRLRFRFSGLWKIAKNCGGYGIIQSILKVISSAENCYLKGFFFNGEGLGQICREKKVALQS